MFRQINLLEKYFFNYFLIYIFWTNFYNKIKDSIKKIFLNFHLFIKIVGFRY
jgi:hypothetical protein